MRIAGATFSFGEITLEESAGVLRDIGFDLADVGAGWSSYHQVMPQEAVDDPDVQADRLRRVMDQHGLGFSELFIMHFGKPINHPDGSVRDWTRGMYESPGSGWLGASRSRATSGRPKLSGWRIRAVLRSPQVRVVRGRSAGK